MVAVVLPHAAGCAFCAACRHQVLSGIEALVQETLAPPVVAKVYAAKKKKPNRGLGLGPEDPEEVS